MIQNGGDTLLNKQNATCALDMPFVALCDLCKRRKKGETGSKKMLKKERTEEELQSS